MTGASSPAMRAAGPGSLFIQSVGGVVRRSAGLLLVSRRLVFRCRVLRQKLRWFLGSCRQSSTLGGKL